MTTYNDPKRVDLQAGLDLDSGKTVSTDSELTRRILQLKLVGRQLLDAIEPQLEALQPGRERTDEELNQVCIALALFVEYLMRAESGRDADVQEGGPQVAGRDGSGSDLGG